MRYSLAAGAVVAAVAAAHAMPVEETPYGRSGLRLEMRPNPQDVKDSAARGKYERELAAAGFQSRWIDIVWVMGEPLIPNSPLPTIGPQAMLDPLKPRPPAAR